MSKVKINGKTFLAPEFDSEGNFGIPTKLYEYLLQEFVQKGKISARYLTSYLFLVSNQPEKIDELIGSKVTQWRHKKALKKAGLLSI